MVRRPLKWKQVEAKAVETGRTMRRVPKSWPERPERGRMVCGRPKWSRNEVSNAKNSVPHTPYLVVEKSKQHKRYNWRTSTQLPSFFLHGGNRSFGRHVVTTILPTHREIARKHCIILKFCISSLVEKPKSTIDNLTMTVRGPLVGCAGRPRQDCALHLMFAQSMALFGIYPSKFHHGFKFIIHLLTSLGTANLERGRVYPCKGLFLKRDKIEVPMGIQNVWIRVNLTSIARSDIS